MTTIQVYTEHAESFHVDLVVAFCFTLGMICTVTRCFVLAVSDGNCLGPFQVSRAFAARFELCIF